MLPRAASSVTMHSRGQWEQARTNCTTFLWRIIHLAAGTQHQLPISTSTSLLNPHL